MNYSRRNFLQTAAFSPVFAGLGMYASAPETMAQTNANSKIKFQLGLASYSFRNFDRAKIIAMTKRAGWQAKIAQEQQMNPV